MPSQTIIDSANILQSCIPLLSLSAYLPQWHKIVTTKSSRDISLRAWLIWSFSSSIAVYYAVVQYLVTGQGAALMFSSSVLLVFVIVTACLVVNYRKPNGTGVA
jgi:uncharacterized protein with PQ loop repeat